MKYSNGILTVNSMIYNSSLPWYLNSFEHGWEFFLFTIQVRKCL